MVDVFHDICDELYNEMAAKYPEAVMASEYVRSPADFPFVSVEQADSYQARQRFDSSGEERYNTITLRINVYSNKTTAKQEECRTIMNILDRKLYCMNFVRLSMSPIPNMADATIYRVVAMYRAETDGQRLFRA